MAKLITETEERDIADGDPITDACEDMGVPFGCIEGICGSCVIDIIEGEDNLSEVTEDEVNFDLHKTKRLACRCTIKRGEVRIKF